MFLFLPPWAALGPLLPATKSQRQKQKLWELTNDILQSHSLQIWSAGAMRWHCRPPRITSAPRPTVWPLVGISPYKCPQLNSSPLRGTSSSWICCFSFPITQHVSFNSSFAVSRQTQSVPKIWSVCWCSFSRLYHPLSQWQRLQLPALPPLFLAPQELLPMSGFSLIHLSYGHCQILPVALFLQV